MKIASSVLALLAIATATTAYAAPVKNPLSVHVLNLQTGVPTAGITVELDQQQNDKWTKLATGVTDNNGRISALYPADKPVVSGSYRVVFKTGDYYARTGEKTFFPQIPVEFTLEKSGDHYHIPLLLSPFGYSTYRGN